MTIHVIPVILCGGSGTRLWPLSRNGFPKQFLVLAGNESLFQQAVRRVAGVADGELQLGRTLVVTNDEQRFLVLSQLAELERDGVDGGATLLLEPTGRNTAPALTLAALQAAESGEDPVLVVTPADQVVTDVPTFTHALQAAVRVAGEGSPDTICVLGITPDRPETGYGYVRRGEAAGALGEFAVRQFVEKPTREVAEGYLAGGDYLWNSGMFVLRASAWLNALERYRPDIAEAARKAWAARAFDASFVRPGKAEFAAVPSESIDYAVMEPGSRNGLPLKLVPLNAGWSDLGAWDAVWQVAPKDDAGNATQGDVLLEGSRNTLVHATSRLVGAVGLEDVVVVETADAVLVADRRRSQDVKAVVARLAAAKRTEHNLHRRVHRPWGWYDSIDFGPRFQVKRIMVNPKAKLSLQMHYHRAEHWIVVSGTAEVTVGDKVVVLGENQSTYIPLGTVHRLANPGTIPLEIIEVQSGPYLGEDDIVRYEDSYGRG
jgi:mannose-1-phosphate guanylyltransferase/mannose-6-phosphate isomerase